MVEPRSWELELSEDSEEATCNALSGEEETEPGLDAPEEENQDQSEPPL
jgi:hypothetical protein